MDAAANRGIDRQHARTSQGHRISLGIQRGAVPAWRQGCGVAAGIGDYRWDGRAEQCPTA